MRVRARARQQGIELPLVISDHADWNELTATIAETGAGEVWVTHGREETPSCTISNRLDARAARSH
jgi:putative mRNA 3-end processing factor